MNFFRVSVGQIKPTKKHRNSPGQNQLITFLVSAVSLALCLILYGILGSGLLVLLGFVLSIAALFVMPMLLLRKGKMVQFTTTGIYIGNKAETKIPTENIAHISFELGPKPEPPRRANAQLLVGIVVVQASEGVSVTESATYHLVHITTGNGSEETQILHFAMGHPKEYNALIQIVKQWKEAGISVQLHAFKDQ